MAQSSVNGSTVARASSWQDGVGSLGDLGRVLYDSKRLCDVTFRVGHEEVKIEAHKLILAATNPVFETMLSVVPTEYEAIEVPDVDPEAFQGMLRFLYKNEKPALTLQNIQSFFKVANTYHIMELKKSCDDFVESLLDRNNDYFSDRNSTDTLWELFLAGVACKSESLLSHCYSAIDKNAAKFFTWLPVTEQDVSVVWLADILRRDTLYCPEYLIYRSVIQFAEKECKRRCMEASAANCRKVLGTLFLLIRFPQMTVSEIRKGPRESGILTDGEVCDLLLYMMGVEDVHVPYPKEPRSWSQKSSKTHEIIRRGNGQLVYCVDSALIDAAISNSTSCSQAPPSRLEEENTRKKDEQEAHHQKLDEMARKQQQRIREIEEREERERQQEHEKRLEPAQPSPASDPRKHIPPSQRGPRLPELRRKAYVSQ